MRELSKRWTLETVVGGDFSVPRPAPNCALPGDAVNGGSRNGTERWLFRVSDAGFIGEIESRLQVGSQLDRRDLSKSVRSEFLVGSDNYKLSEVKRKVRRREKT
jgi:hypothetical protein